MSKYNMFKDWQKVREYYGINEDEYKNYIEGIDRWQSVLDGVPDDVMSEMKEYGWNTRTINEFVSCCHSMFIDYRYGWEQCKLGVTLDELMQQKVESERLISELIDKYVNSEITDDEFKKSVVKINMVEQSDADKFLSDAIECKQRAYETHKKRSGITDTEFKAIYSSGITNPMDIFRAKYVSKATNTLLDNVIKSRLENDNWLGAVADILNIPHDEYQKQINDASQK